MHNKIRCTKDWKQGSHCGMWAYSTAICCSSRKRRLESSETGVACKKENQKKKSKPLPKSWNEHILSRSKNTFLESSLWVKANISSPQHVASLDELHAYMTGQCEWKKGKRWRFKIGCDCPNGLIVHAFTCFLEALVYLSTRRGIFELGLPWTRRQSQGDTSKYARDPQRSMRRQSRLKIEDSGKVQRQRVSACVCACINLRKSWTELRAIKDADEVSIVCNT